MSETPIEEFLSLMYISASGETMKNAVFSSPRGGDVLKIKYTLKKISGKTAVQAEYSCTEGRVRQKNFAPGNLVKSVKSDIASFTRADLNDSGGSASLMTSKKGKVTLVRHGKIGTGDSQVASADKVKNYILSGSEPFLFHLDISDKNGRIHDKKQAKYRQINRFLEMVRDVENQLPKNGEIRIADLCCGKSYLSFAVYHYFANIKKRPVKMDCVDLKQSVMDECAAIAENLGFDGMSFSAGDISQYKPSAKPHLVISLHACDTATDTVLDAGVRCGADVILSTPCCHRQLSRDIDCEALKFVTRHAMLRYKLCDAATDALRLLRLESCGYDCDALELVDPEDTPKNILLRAVRRRGVDYGDARQSAKTEEYKTAYKFLTGKEAPPLPGKE